MVQLLIKEIIRTLVIRSLKVILLISLVIYMTGCKEGEQASTERAVDGSFLYAGTWNGPVGGGAGNWCRDDGAGGQVCDIAPASTPAACSGVTLLNGFTIYSATEGAFSSPTPGIFASFPMGQGEPITYSNGQFTVVSNGYTFRLTAIPNTSTAIVEFAAGCARAYYWGSL